MGLCKLCTPPRYGLSRTAGDGCYPIQDAEVTLISNSHPYGTEKSRDSQATNEKGIAEFESNKEWRTEMLLILHGAEVFFGNWCVRKNGFETFVTKHRSGSEFERKTTITSSEGESVKCPEDMS